MILLAVIYTKKMNFSLHSMIHAFQHRIGFLSVAETNGAQQRKRAAPAALAGLDNLPGASSHLQERLKRSYHSVDALRKANIDEKFKSERYLQTSMAICQTPINTYVNKVWA